jgi:hypothetical protein
MQSAEGLGNLCVLKVLYECLLLILCELKHVAI